MATARINGTDINFLDTGGSFATNLTHPQPTNAAIRAFVDRLER